MTAATFFRVLNEVVNNLPSLRSERYITIHRLL